MQAKATTVSCCRICNDESSFLSHVSHAFHIEKMLLTQPEPLFSLVNLFLVSVVSSCSGRRISGRKEEKGHELDLLKNGEFSIGYGGGIGK